MSSSSESDSSDSDASSKKHKKKSKRTKKSKKRSKKYSKVKAIEPDTYDGSEDTQKFHRFGTEMLMYFKDAKISSKRQAYVMSHYLRGEAYEYYIREVSYNSRKSRSPPDGRELLKGLFNHCFSVDFRDKQREKLKRCYQNDRSVKKYVSEINELFTTIGYADKRERVNRLWRGFRPEIQQALWKDKLHPDRSKWDKV
ncbi:hypothetical protein BJ165DRAFT_1356096, partial [Panaeolus papilionaceus]